MLFLFYPFSRIINQDPYGEGWIWKMTISDAGELDSLLDAAAYSELIGE